MKANTEGHWTILNSRQKQIPSARSQVPETDSWSEQHQNKPRKSDGGERMGSSRETQGGSSIFGIRQILAKVH
jgi:hypothetical protein